MAWEAATLPDLEALAAATLLDSEALAAVNTLASSATEAPAESSRCPMAAPQVTAAPAALEAERRTDTPVVRDSEEADLAAATAQFLLTAAAADTEAAALEREALAMLVDTALREDTADLEVRD